MVHRRYYTRVKVTKNFYLDEFVDPHTYFTRPDNGLSMIDNRLFTIAQKLRDLYGSGVRINNWWWYYEKYKIELKPSQIVTRIERSSSCNKWSGLRTDRCRIGSSRSAHKMMHSGKGMAIDPKRDSKTFDRLVRENAQEFYILGLRRLEDISITPTWLHMDLLERNTRPNSIRVVDRTRATDIITW